MSVYPFILWGIIRLPVISLYVVFFLHPSVPHTHLRCVIVQFSQPSLSRYVRVPLYIVGNNSIACDFLVRCVFPTSLCAAHTRYVFFLHPSVLHTHLRCVLFLHPSVPHTYLRCVLFLHTSVLHTHVVRYLYIPLCRTHTLTLCVIPTSLCAAVPHTHTLERVIDESDDLQSFKVARKYAP